jgi:hypothetical protein
MMSLSSWAFIRGETTVGFPPAPPFLTLLDLRLRR